MSWDVRVLTIFPEMFPGPLGESLAASGALAAAVALESLAAFSAPASAWAISWGDQCCDLLCLHKVLD